VERPESLKLEIDVPIKMRDAVILRGDIWRPDDGKKHPVILTRLPYDKSAFFASGGGYMNFQRFARAGYVCIAQDCRGTGASDGEFFPWRDDTDDGYDTIEWIAAQAWCNGNIGMMGPSALAGTQWNAAITRPPHLKAICPAMTSTINRGVPFLENGAFLLRIMLQWYLGMCHNALRRSQLPEKKLVSLRERLTAVMDNLDEQLRFLPLKKVPAAEIANELGMPPFYSDFFDNIDNAAFWETYRSPVPLERVICPALHITGWYDPPLGAVLASYTHMREKAESELARQNQKLIIGPWIHGGGLPPNADLINLKTSATGDLAGAHLRWFDHWLKGLNNGVDREPPVRIFIMGDNIWRSENEWPLARTKYTNYYLHSRGDANTRFGGGVLSAEHPADEQPDIYLYDPRNVPKVLERGPQDQEELEKRADVLVYTTPPLETDIEITGPVKIILYAASSAPDTDFMGKVVDVLPDGRSINLNMIGGMVRARYRQGESSPTLIKPGQVYEYSIDLKAIGNVFKAGHRIRLQLSSSNFPMWDRNLNTGHAIGQDAEINMATQTIYHTNEYTSHLVLPVIPR
jgi:putative CocE/NonD family hydrolase